MKLINLILFFQLTFSVYTYAQCFNVEADIAGMDNSSFQAALEAAACQLRDSFPEMHQNDFKVFDFGFYSIHENQQGGFQAVWDKVKENVTKQSKYYLLFGKITNSTGVYVEFWVDLVLPRDNIFFCIDQLSLNLRENLRKKYEISANEIHDSNGLRPNQYHLAEIEVMKQLGEYIGGLRQCCDFSNRSSDQCSACVLSNAQFEKTVDKAGLLSASVSKVIDNTHPGMGAEEIGYTIESKDLTINLDQAITDFKAQIHSKFPDVTIKTYPFNFQTGCDDFDEIYNSFKATNVDIGIIIGVTGVDGKAGNIWWQMISKDDDPITPTSFNSDTCYYFNKDKKYTHKKLCTGGITPRGVLQNLDGNNFDFEFRFSNPEITPRTLTTGAVRDALGNWKDYGSTKEPLLNEALIMSKNMIFARLVEAIPDQKGGNKPGAFDFHGYYSPISLLSGSFGFSAPFDYSTKEWFLDRRNFLFITQTIVGSDVVGHDYRNMGNFLWGAASYIMGVPEWMALSGAHLANLWREEGLTLDAPDDQYAIKLGRYYAKIVRWKTIYGGKNNIFR